MAVGLLPADRRTGAEVLARAPVHGLATLAVGGPLRSIDPRDLQRVMGLVLDVVTGGPLRRRRTGYRRPPAEAHADCTATV